jgi:hypothetical protein
MGVRYTALGKETVAYGTPAAATRYLEAIASIKPDQNWVIPPPIASRAFRKRNLGPYRARGNIGDFPVEPENIGELLFGVFGSVNSAQQGGTTAYLHTFTPADTLPSYTVRLSADTAQRILPGGLIEALTIKFGHDKDIQAIAEILSGFPEETAALETPTISTLQALNMQDAASVLTILGTSKRNLIYDLEINIKNNIPFDRGDLSGRSFATKRVGQREITGKISMYFDDTMGGEYDKFMTATEFALIINARGPLIVGSYYYFLELELRKCVYLKDSVPDVKPQNEPVVVDAPFKAFYDTTGGFNAEIKAKLQNTITAY